MADKRLDIEIVANDRASRPIKNLQSTIIRFVGAVSASLAALQAVVFPINSAREFERVLRDVQKTTGFVNEEIEILGSELLDLSRTVDTSATDLGRIAAAAGQLGLGEAGGQAILSFTDSIARAATTLDLTAEQAATSFAKIASIFNIPISQTEKLTSTINELSNTTTATADQLLDVIRRVGTVAGSFEDVAALAAQAIQLGLSPETAGTSLVKIFSRFESEADKFAEAFGITVGEFLGKGVLERWEFYIGELAKLTDEEAAKLINTLSGSGRIFALVDKQVQDARNGFEIFRAAQENARTAFEEGTSAQEEYLIVSQSLDRQLAILRNNFTALATEIGLSLVPQLIAAVRQLQEFLQTERARIFFEALGQSIVALITIFERFVNVLTTLGAGELLNVFQIGLAAVVVGAVRLTVRTIQGAIARIVEFGQRTLAADRQARAAAGSIGQSLATAFGLVKKSSEEASASVTRTNTAVDNTIRTYQGATAALGQYVDATNLAVVANQKLAASTRATRAAQTEGAAGAAAGIGAATAVDQGAAQARVRAIQQEIQLLGQKKAEQAVIINQAKQELDNIKVRATVTRQVNRLQGRISQASKTNLKLFVEEADIQKGIIAGANQRLTALRANGRELDSQLATWKQIQVTAQSTAFAEIANAGRGTRQLDGLARAALGVQTGFERVGRAGSTVNRAFSTLGRGAGALINSFRALTPVVRVFTVALRGLFALFGGPIGVAITAFIFFGDTIIAKLKEILGLVTRTEAEITEINRIEARNRQGIINQQIADYRRLQRAITDLADLDTEVAEFDSGGTFAETAQFAGNAAKQLDDYGRAAQGAATEQKLLNDQLFALEGRRGRLEAQIRASREAEEIRELGAERRKLVEEIEKVAAARDKAQADSEAFSQASRIAAEELVQSFTAPVAQIVELQSAYRDAAEEAGQLGLRAQQLSTIDTRVSVVAELEDEDLENFRAQITRALGPDRIQVGDAIGQDLAEKVTEAINSFNRELDASRQRAEELGKATTDAVDALTPSDRATVQATQLLNLQKGTLDILKEQLKDSEAITREESERTKFLRDNADEILAQKFAYDLQLEQLEKIEKSLADNRKAAQGIFDNTAAESRALTQELENVQRSLRDILDLREDERDIARDIARAEEEIADNKQQIVDLEQQLAQTSDVYQRNKIRAQISELQSKTNIQETLRFERQREQATLKFNALLEKIGPLTREAREAAAEGQVGPLQAIKEQIDSAIDESGSILQDIANLQDAEGNFLFREGEIKDFEDALSGTVEDYQDVLPNINKLLRDSALAAEREIADTIRQFTAQNQELVTNFDELLKEFPGIAKSLDVVRVAWQRANQPLIAAIEKFGQQQQANVLAGRGLGEGLAAGLAEQQQAAAREARRPGNLGDKQLYQDAIVAATAGADLSQYKANVEKAQAEGATDGLNAIKIDEQGGYVGAVQDATTLAVQNALNDLDTGQLQQPALAPSERAAQPDVPTQAELTGDPTQQVLNQVEQQTRGIILAASRESSKQGVTEGVSQGAKAGFESAPAKAAAQKLGQDVVDGIAIGFGAGGPIGAAVGALLGNIVDDFKQLAKQIRGEIKAGDPRAPGNPLIPGLAGGGEVHGPGTGTSDSILARLSRGEFVSDAATVDFFSPGFFHGLKKLARSRNASMRRMMGSIPGFAGGGLVGRQNTGMSNVHLHMPSGDVYDLIGDNDTVSQMQRAFSREALKKGRKR